MLEKSLRKLLTIAKESPEAFDWMAAMENKYQNYIPVSRRHNKSIKTPIVFFRKGLSVSDILKMSENEFELAVDDSVYTEQEIDGIELDLSNGCVESCEVF